MKHRPTGGLDPTGASEPVSIISQSRMPINSLAAVGSACIPIVLVFFRRDGSPAPRRSHDISLVLAPVPKATSHHLEVTRDSLKLAAQTCIFDALLSGRRGR
jgi:hypothetical protein